MAVNPLDRVRDGIALIAERLPGRLGVLVRYVNHDGEIAFNADALFAAASVIKIPIMVEVFRQVEDGFLSLREPLELQEEDLCGGSGMLQYLHRGLELTVRDAVELMIAISDNTATNMLLRRIGGRDAVNATMDRLGFPCTRSAGFIGRPDAPEAWEIERLSRTTPRDMANLLIGLAGSEIVSEAASRSMLDILGHQQHDAMLPRYLPIGVETSGQETVRVAHKTGSISGVRNDVGIITVTHPEPVRRVVVSAFTGGVEDGDLWTVENIAILAVADVARLAYEALVS